MTALPIVKRFDTIKNIFACFLARFDISDGKPVPP
jgi:hypothetical protein